MVRALLLKRPSEVSTWVEDPFGKSQPVWQLRALPLCVDRVQSEAEGKERDGEQSCKGEGISKQRPQLTGEIIS